MTDLDDSQLNIWKEQRKLLKQKLVTNNVEEWQDNVNDKLQYVAGVDLSFFKVINWFYF